MSAHHHFFRSWGAEPVAGGARFRLWAPAKDAVSLQIAQSGETIPMAPSKDGWFQIETDAVAENDGYRFLLEDGMAVPDPAARAQVGDVHGPSRLVDPNRFAWTSVWPGRPWEEAVIYEMHVGAFTDEGTFDAVQSRLDHLLRTGVTAIELMPVAQFAGRRGWGYDGVCLYAPHEAYGGPEGLKRLIDAAHHRGLMVMLDVVYNHFGPEGNYLHLYAPDFFDPSRQTPWGSGIAFERPAVRAFFIENALYWLEEFRFDGLRLDAINQIVDPSPVSILEEIARSIRARIVDRPVHLTTEDERNITALHERDRAGRVRLYTAEWNDDVHHAAHVIATAETLAYYADYAERPAALLARALATGYIYQGETSIYRDEPRGAPSAHLPPAAFINFLQNHDQVGNRAHSERLTALADSETIDTLLAVLLLSPQIPMLFMGEEWGETNPFGFFTDFHGELGRAVREGRRREFADWPQFVSEEHSARIADPNAEETFLAAKLDWGKLDHPVHRRCLEHVRRLLDVRHREIVPFVAGLSGNAGVYEMLGDDAFVVVWQRDSGGALRLAANLGSDPVAAPSTGRVVFDRRGTTGGVLAPGGVRCAVLDAFTVGQSVREGG